MVKKRIQSKISTLSFIQCKNCGEIIRKSDWNTFKTFCTKKCRKSYQKKKDKKNSNSSYKSEWRHNYDRK